jgi:nucleoid DNA-binding protein
MGGNHPRRSRNASDEWTQLGEELIISSRRVVTFRASPRLKTEVNAFKVEHQDTEGLLSPGQ